MTNRGDERSSVLRRRASLRSYFAWLFERGHIESNPCGAPARAQGHASPAQDRGARAARQTSWTTTGAKTSGPCSIGRCARFSTARGCASRNCAASISTASTSRGPAARLGKGRKERVVPLHRKGLDAVHLWIEDARDDVRARDSPTRGAVFQSSRAVASGRATCDASSISASSTATCTPTLCATPSPPTSSREAPTCASSRSSSATRA